MSSLRNQPVEIMKHFFNHFFVAIGACASVLTMISFFFNIVWTNYPCWTWFFIITILLVCFFYAYTQVYRKKKIIIPITQHFSLTIKEGDLYKQHGIIVIPINNYFDTDVGNNIIKQESVPGQYIISHYQDNVGNLDNKIAQYLNEQGIKGEKVDIPKNGKNIKYPLGTCVDVVEDGNHYVWVVSTEYDENDNLVLSRKDLSIVLYGLFNHLESIQDNKTIYMPVIGAGFTRLDRNPERILHYIIDYFDFSLSDKKFYGNVQIVIRSLEEINLNRIENIFNKRQE